MTKITLDVGGNVKAVLGLYQGVFGSQVDLQGGAQSYSHLNLLKHFDFSQLDHSDGSESIVAKAKDFFNKIEIDIPVDNFMLPSVDEDILKSAWVKSELLALAKGVITNRPQGFFSGISNSVVKKNKSGDLGNIFASYRDLILALTLGTLDQAVQLPDAQDQQKIIGLRKVVEFIQSMYNIDMQATKNSSKDNFKQVLYNNFLSIIEKKISEIELSVDSRSLSSNIKNVLSLMEKVQVALPDFCSRNLIFDDNVTGSFSAIQDWQNKTYAEFVKLDSSCCEVLRKQVNGARSFQSIIQSFGLQPLNNAYSSEQVEKQVAKQLTAKSGTELGLQGWKDSRVNMPLLRNLEGDKILFNTAGQMAAAGDDDVSQDAAEIQAKTSFLILVSCLVPRYREISFLILQFKDVSALVDQVGNLLKFSFNSELKLLAERVYKVTAELYSIINELYSQKRKILLDNKNNGKIPSDRCKIPSVFSCTLIGCLKQIQDIDLKSSLNSNCLKKNKQQIDFLMHRVVRNMRDWGIGGEANEKSRLCVGPNLLLDMTSNAQQSSQHSPGNSAHQHDQWRGGDRSNRSKSENCLVGAGQGKPAPVVSESVKLSVANPFAQYAAVQGGGHRRAQSESAPGLTRGLTRGLTPENVD